MLLAAIFRPSSSKLNLFLPLQTSPRMERDRLLIYKAPCPAAPDKSVLFHMESHTLSQLRLFRQLHYERWQAASSCDKLPRFNNIHIIICFMLVPILREAVEPSRSEVKNDTVFFFIDLRTRLGIWYFGETFMVAFLNFQAFWDDLVS